MLILQIFLLVFTTLLASSCNTPEVIVQKQSVIGISSSFMRGRTVPAPIYGITLNDVSDAVRPGITQSILSLNHFPTSRIVFDSNMAANYYSTPVNDLNSHTYIMGELLDSAFMTNFTVPQYQARVQSYLSALGDSVDIWEIGNEVNGGWLGSNTEDKVQVAYDLVSSQNRQTAVTFFWEGTSADQCWESPQNEMFAWINNMFQLNINPAQRNPDRERLRLGLNYAMISWYPEGCANITPDWNSIFTQLASIFPNAKVGFGELGTHSPQFGSTYEINLINQYYPTANHSNLPSNFIGGYFWWNYASEMVPESNPIFNVLNNSIR